MLLYREMNSAQRFNAQMIFETLVSHATADLLKELKDARILTNSNTLFNYIICFLLILILI
jgi:hypothetical protein